MIISVFAEKIFDKMEHSFMLSILNKQKLLSNSFYAVLLPRSQHVNVDVRGFPAKVRNKACFLLDCLILCWGFSSMILDEGNVN